MGRTDSPTSMQAGDGKKPVTDQWLPPFVVVDEDGKPVGTIEVQVPSACGSHVSICSHVAYSLTVCSQVAFNIIGFLHPHR